jgi:serine O-acetyltransferase
MLNGFHNNNPIDLSLLQIIREDFQTHGSDFFEQGFWALVVHRFGNWRMGIRLKVVRAPFSLLYKFLYRWVEWTCGISLPYTVKVGRRVRLWHHGGMILHAHSIGDDCHIRHCTTFGVSHTHANGQIPIIGNRVDIGAGACVLGHVIIGDGVVIGANAVVLKDVPAGGVAVGVPARVIRVVS